MVSEHGGVGSTEGQTVPKVTGGKWLKDEERQSNQEMPFFIAGGMVFHYKRIDRSEFYQRTSNATNVVVDLCECSCRRFKDLVYGNPQRTGGYVYLCFDKRMILCHWGFVTGMDDSFVISEMGTLSESSEYWFQAQVKIASQRKKLCFDKRGKKNGKKSS